MSSHNPVYNLLKFVDCQQLATTSVQHVNATDTIEVAVKKLSDKNVLAAPVLKDDKLIGVFETQELVHFLVSCLSKSTSAADSEKLLQTTVADVLKAATRSHAYSPLSPGDTAIAALELFCIGIYRAPLLSLDHKLVGLLTQVDVMLEAAAILRSGATAKSMGERTLEQLGLGSTPPMLVLASQSVGDTLTELDEFQVSAFPVIDESGKLVAKFSLSNVLALFGNKSKLDASLSEPIGKFVAGQPKSVPVTAQRSETLTTVITRMIDKQVHRLWIVDKNEKPVGVVSMTDLCKVIRDYTEDGAPNALGQLRDGLGVSFRSITHPTKALGFYGEMLCLLDAENPDALWNVTLSGNRAILQASNGKHVCIDSKHHITFIPTVTEDCKLKLLDAETGAVALGDCNGGFITEGDVVLSAPTKTGAPTKKSWFKMMHHYNKLK